MTGLIRTVQGQGGFATVLAKGEKDAGTILILTIEKGGNGTLYERMPQLDGTRKFVQIKTQDPENKKELDEYMARRRHQDGDVWIIELDIANAERFIASLSV